MPKGTPVKHPKSIDVNALRRVVEIEISQGAVPTIAIDGLGGSGKSTFAVQLAEKWPKALVVQMDDFYKPIARRTRSPETPGANFELQRIVGEVLRPHSEGRATQYQRYDWTTDALAEWHTVPADSIVILEGYIQPRER